MTAFAREYGHTRQLPMRRTPCDADGSELHVGEEIEHLRFHWSGNILKICQRGDGKFMVTVETLQKRIFESLSQHLKKLGTAEATETVPPAILE